MAIPAEEQASLSSYRKQQETAAAPPLPAGADEQWVSVRGARAELWPRLRKFFTDKDFGLELDDADLGVMETGWGAPFESGGAMQRERFKIFTEPGGTDDVTVLFISSERQEQPPGASDWQDMGNSSGAEKQIAGELNVYFNSGVARATAAPSATVAAPPTQALASIESTEDGRRFLSIADEFTVAWRNTEKALQRGGFFIAGSDPSAGVYQVSYFEGAGAGDEKKGWFSRLAFWKDEEPGAMNYRIGLTGVGNRTELIVMNDDGDWDSSEEAGRILAIISSQYGAQ